MKKNYQKPAMQVVKIQRQGVICSSVNSINSGDVGIGYGGASNSSSGPARSRSTGDTD